MRFYPERVIAPPVKPSEALAWMVIARHSKPRWLKNADLNTGHAVHDFDIMRGPTPMAAVEVTEDRDEAAAGWHAKRIEYLDVTPCRLGWEISINRYPDRPRSWAKKVLAPFLLGLEEAHAAGVTIYPDSPFQTTIPAGISDLGFVAALPDPPGSPPLVPGTVRLRVGWVGSSHPNKLADWVEGFVASGRCEGERRKLARSGRNERHLAVVVPFMPASSLEVHGCLMTVANYGPPARHPVLPTEITHLWLISDYPNTPSLRYTSHGWTVLAPVQPVS
ncbi:hypothetical protein [Micromonospora rubida]|uniref:hypothetical protein n=1 Tax=Micromonospora rubida TaxID=2697657 RepID=UPI0013767964|nr:hypothetical protein [Micromonospora rubida]NBE80371.1 hypothetical protein [Micromonospora rubida]